MVSGRWSSLMINKMFGRAANTTPTPCSTTAQAHAKKQTTLLKLRSISSHLAGFFWPANGIDLLSPRRCGGLDANDELVARFELAGDELGKVTVGNAGLDFHGAELIAVLDPDVAAAALLAGFGPFVSGQARVGKLVLLGLRVLPA